MNRTSSSSSSSSGSSSSKKNALSKGSVGTATKNSLLQICYRINLFLRITRAAFNGNRAKIEFGILKANIWKVLFALFIHYLHSIAHNYAYFVHQQTDVLYDIGFEHLPEITDESLRGISEVVLLIILISAIILSFAPWYLREPAAYMSELWIRAIYVTAACIGLRCLSFMATSLPGPAPHCRPDSAEYNPPADMYAVLTTMDWFKSCGDLIFSSHTSFAMTFLLCVHCYLHRIVGKRMWIYYLIIYGYFWPLFVIMCVLIIASRKHYTVDVVVAVYVCPLVYYASYKWFKDQHMLKQQLPSASGAGAGPGAGGANTKGGGGGSSGEGGVVMKDEYTSILMEAGAAGNTNNTITINDALTLSPSQAKAKNMKRHSYL